MSAADFMRGYRLAVETGCEKPPRQAIGHMPFAGHRTAATIWAQQRAARAREDQQIRRRMEYGFDPGCLRSSEK